MDCLTGANWIGGVASREGSRVFHVHDPRTGKELDIPFNEATGGEVGRAAGLADEAFSESKGFATSRFSDLLDAVAGSIEGLGQKLIETADLETALGVPRLESERARTCDQLRMFAEILREGSHVEAVIETALPDREPRPKPDLRRMLVPMGPVGVFGASNFPLAFGVVGGDTASAWAAGCPVVAKGHPSHAGTSELLAMAVNSAVEKIGFPAGWFSLLQGPGLDVGRALVIHPSISAIGFTGSLRGGRAIFELALSREEPVPVYAEMGSLNPMFISQGALEQRAEFLAQAIVGSVTVGVGQFCTKPGLIIVPDSEEGAGLAKEVAARMSQLPCGRLLNRTILEKLSDGLTLVSDIPGMEVLTGGKRAEGEGYCYSNTVLKTDLKGFLGHPELSEERFGPIALFVTCRDILEMEGLASSLRGHLVGVIYAEMGEMKALSGVYNALVNRVGRVVWNGQPTGVEVCSAMMHGGPYPATTAPWSTSVGRYAIRRFLRPVAFQNVPQGMLPEQLRDHNPLGIMRLVDGRYTRDRL